MQPALGSNVGGTANARHPKTPLPSHDTTLDDLRREFGDRGDIAAIAQGYRAVLRDTSGRAPVLLYGRTPAELAEPIRMAEVSP